MRKHYHKITLVIGIAAIMLAQSISALAAGSQTAVDTIVLETEAASESEISADLDWKTKNDNGQWIEDLSVTQGTNSLVVVINSLDETEDRPSSGTEDGGKRKSRKTVPGNSKLYYFSKEESGEWHQVFSVNCFISGGEMADSHVYGVYSPVSTFGLLENPGSLLSYMQIDSDDCWVVDRDSEDYGTIVKEKPEGSSSAGYVNLSSMKAFSNYGMVLQPEGLYDDQPSILMNCQQADVNNRSVSSIQLSEKQVRMLIQSIDGDAKVAIVESLDDLEDL